MKQPWVMIVYSRVPYLHHTRFGPMSTVDIAWEAVFNQCKVRMSVNRCRKLHKLFVP
jgi:hypothetical protein